MQTCFFASNAFFKNGGCASFQATSSLQVSLLSKNLFKSLLFFFSNGKSRCPRSDLEAEMGVFHEEIEHLNGHIATLFSTIRSLRRAISNLQDAAFEAGNDELDPEFRGGQEAEGTEEDSDVNPNASDDRSNAANDASDGANLGSGDDGRNEVDDDAFAVFDRVDSD